MITDAPEEISVVIQDTVITSKPANKARFVKLLSISGLSIAVLLPIGVYPRLMQAHELQTSQAQAIEQLPVVAVAKPLSAPPTKTLLLTGSLEPIQQTPIYARSNGYIRTRLVDIGDQVKAGQQLATVETPEIEDAVREAKARVFTDVANQAEMVAQINNAKADYQKAIANLAQARSNLLQRRSDETFARTTDSRWQVLVQQGAVAAQDGDDKRTKLATSKAATQAALDAVTAAESDVVASKARMAAADAKLNAAVANVSATRARASETETQKQFQNITAPFAGVITQRNVDTGTLVTSGSETSKQPMFQLAKIDTLKVVVDVPQFAAAGIHVGETVGITLKQLPGKLFTGTVARTSVALDPTARTLKTEVHIANSDLSLSPGMYSEVRFVIPRTQKTLLVPASALVIGAEGTRIAVVTGDKVHYQKVEVGDDLGKQIEIMGGLSETEAIVVNPRDTLTAGSKVKTQAASI